MGKTWEKPLGVVVVVVVVSPGAPTPPLCAKAACEPSAANATAKAETNSDLVRGVRATGLSVSDVPTLSAAYGVSWRARA